MLLLQVLRFIHILSAIFWVGTNLFTVFFLEPTVRALGPEGGNFMQRLSGGTRFSLIITLAGFLTILAGLWMYWIYSGGFEPSVMFSQRLPLTLGAIFGIGALIVGGTMQGRPSGQLAALGKQIATQQGPANPEQKAEMAALQKRMRIGARLNAALMVLAVIGMVW